MKYMQKKKLGVSFTGGLARGGSYLGVLKALEENNIQIDYILGASVGAVVGCIYAYTKDLKLITEYAKNLKFRKLLSLESFVDISILGDERFYKLVDELVGDAKLSDTKIPSFVQVTNLSKRKHEYIEEGMIKKLLAATSGFPFFIPPIKLDSKDYYIDGGITGGFGAEFLREKGADIVLGVTTGSMKNQKPALRNPSRKILDAITIAMERINQLDLQLNPVDILITDIGLDVGAFGFDRMDEIVELGYQKTQEKIPVLKRLLN